MSIFDNHLNQIDRDNDKMILEHYKISNSGATLIPKKGTFALTKDQKSSLFRRLPKLSPLPAGTFKEEGSIFKSFRANLSIEQLNNLFPRYVEIIRDMNLPCLIYNQKRYYQVNREVKRKIAYELFKR